MNENRTIETFTFKKGLPGFEDLRSFTLQQHDDVFGVLSSVDNPSVSFVTVNPFDFYQEYEFELTPENVDDLEIANSEQVVVRCIITLHENIQKATGNLIAPIVFNQDKKLGKQIVLHNTAYKTKHYLWSESVTQKEGEL